MEKDLCSQSTWGSKSNKGTFLRDFIGLVASFQGGCNQNIYTNIYYTLTYLGLRVLSLGLSGLAACELLWSYEQKERVQFNFAFANEIH